MSAISSKTLGSVFFSVAVAAAAMIVPASFAQEAENTRYSPQGRQLAGAVAREFGDRTYEVRIYDPEPDVAEFSNATIFYPLTLSFAAPYGAVVLVPGYRGTQELYDWWGPMLATLGMAVMIIDTNGPEDSLEDRSQALIAGINFMKAENANSESPIQGRIDTSKLAIMGHSLGGGGALQAASVLGDDIKAVVPLSPYCCELGQSYEGAFSSVSVPTLIFVSAVDNIAPPETHAKALFDSISSGTHKAYVEFAEGDHNIATNSGTDLGTFGRFTYAWLKMHFDMDPRFAAVFDDVGDEYADKFSRFENTQ